MTKPTRTSAATAFAALTFAAIGFAIYLSFYPDRYIFFGPIDRAQRVNHPGTVVLVCLSMALQACIAWVALLAARPRLLWLRCVMALFILLPWTYFPTMLSGHEASYVLVHDLWEWVVVLCLAALGLVSAIRQLAGRLASQRPAL